jgi:hypothetical protein
MACSASAFHRKVMPLGWSCSVLNADCFFGHLSFSWPFILGQKSLFAATPRLYWTTYLVVVLHTVCISGYYMPSGGGALGPRHLASMLPFLTIPTACGIARYSRTGIALGWCSLLLTGFAATMDAMTPEGISNPLLNYYVHRILKASFTYSLRSNLVMLSCFNATLVLLVIFGAYFSAVCYDQIKAQTEAEPAS